MRSVSEKNHIFGCFVSVTIGEINEDEKTKSQNAEQGRLFRTYIWGEPGIGNVLKALEYKDFCADLRLVLFQFYVNPLPIELISLKEIEHYTKKEKSIGIPIVVNSEKILPKTRKRDGHF
jgi:hypothetical protein